ncbi:helix-turn-helix transcriptional regulator [Herbaspirillum chlorophenolicum]|uniref:Helix-turn-helix transcriptional regulator n=1 Tax=Herbaspirillum chlorophenolicum TaxID=211589 RepID=A0ABW8F5G2_9BURK
MSTNISILLKEIKVATGWSEPALAREIGTSQPTVNRILNGQEECKATTYRAICDLHERTIYITAGSTKAGK